MQREPENDVLRSELLALRRFIDALQNLCEAAEQPRRDDQIIDILEDVLVHARRAINAKDGSLLVLDEATEELVFVIVQGEIPREHLAWRRIPPHQGIAGWVARERRATIVNSTQSDDRFWGDIDKELGFFTNSVLAAPIIGGGRVLGVIEVLNKLDGLRFNAGDEALLTLVCRFAGEVLFNMLERSEHPAVTGQAGPIGV